MIHAKGENRAVCTDRGARRLWIILALAGALWTPAGLLAGNLSPLASEPDWRELDRYQETMKRAEFVSLLEQVYAPNGGWQPYIRVDPGAAVIRKSNVPLNDLYTLRFAPESAPPRAAPAEYWRPRNRIGPPLPAPNRPLEGVKIVLDPGHLGGQWAKLEERWFQLGGANPVMEGEMTLEVARLLRPRLQGLGATQVELTRESDAPSTPLRPPQLLNAAALALEQAGIAARMATYAGPADPNRYFSIAWMSEALFTRAEIRARAERINRQWHPDLVLCLHFNAEAWGDPAKPELIDKNHCHILINGCYEPDEISKDDVRLEMLTKLLNGSHAEELALAGTVAPLFERETGLPAYTYTGKNAARAGAHPYIWTRNLLANRLYRCPVLYIEPYVMNSPEVFARIQAGDYEGTRPFNGVERKSIFREYADAVADGVADYYKTR